MRWYRIPIEDLPASEYFARAERFHHVAEQLPPAIGARFEAMAADALDIANRKAIECLH
jgi:predicted lipid carrier protein YhbT